MDEKLLIKCLIVVLAIIVQQAGENSAVSQEVGIPKISGLEQQAPPALEAPECILNHTTGTNHQRIEKELWCVMSRRSLITLEHVWKKGKG